MCVCVLNLTYVLDQSKCIQISKMTFNGNFSLFFFIFTQKRFYVKWSVGYLLKIILGLLSRIRMGTFQMNAWLHIFSLRHEDKGGVGVGGVGGGRERLWHCLCFCSILLLFLIKNFTLWDIVETVIQSVLQHSERYRVAQQNLLLSYLNTQYFGMQW